MSADQQNSDQPIKRIKPVKLPLFALKDEHISYFGDGFIVVNKPSGWPTQGTVDPSRDHLFAAVQRWHQQKNGKAAYVGLHHRLDRETSGLVLFTTDQRRNRWAAALFKERLIRKSYIAISVDANREFNDTFEVKNHLAKKSMGRGRSKMQLVNSGGDFAHTEFQIKDRQPNKLLVQARPLTGRMHQIRVHLESVGLPIYGDPVYGGAARDWPNLRMSFPRRVMLHASHLEFPDPDTGNLHSVTADMPQDMTEFWG